MTTTHSGGLATSAAHLSSWFFSYPCAFSSDGQLEIAFTKSGLIDPAVLKRAYAPAPNGIYYFSSSLDDRQNALYFFDARTGKKTFLFETKRRVGNGIALSPDGRTLYVTQLDHSGTELQLVPEFWK